MKFALSSEGFDIWAIGPSSVFFFFPHVLLSSLLLSIDRRQSVEEARDTVELAHRYQQRSHLVVGVDLSGDPKVNQCILERCLLRSRIPLMLWTVVAPSRNATTTSITNTINILPWWLCILFVYTMQAGRSADFVPVLEYARKECNLKLAVHVAEVRASLH